MHVCCTVHCDLVETLSKYISVYLSVVLSHAGVYLPYLCERQLTKPHRVMVIHRVMVMSINNVAPGPVSAGPSPA